MTDEFVKWVENIKILVEKRINEYADVNTSIGGPDTVDIIVTMPNGMEFWTSFGQNEFDKNNYNQRRSLAKIRREDLAWQMECYCEEVLRVAKRLKP